MSIMVELNRIPDNLAERCKDECEIIAVIEAETQAFLNQDVAAWGDCWVQEERAKMIAVTATAGIDVQMGWSAIDSVTRAAIKNGQTCDMARFQNSEYQIQIENDLAWIVYEQHAVSRSGRAWATVETRILERTALGWKIVYCSVVDQGRDTRRTGYLSVDKTGQVLWASQETIEKLADHPILTLSAGRVRARRRHWDHALQAAISRAGRYHAFYELRSFEDEAGVPFEYPAVLGETDEGGIAVVHVSVRDGSTQLQFEGAKSIDHRLAIAQEVFGLSDAQRNVAHYIADGIGPKGAAEALGVSVNTVRTHLVRLYEKTGVNSQAALIRVLLSVG